MGGPEEDHEDSVSVSLSSRPVRCGRKRAPPPFMAVAESPLFDTVVVLDRLPDPSEGDTEGGGDDDQGPIQFTFSKISGGV